MYGEGYRELTEAMEYILDEEKASENLLQFSEKDKITIIPFNSGVMDIWSVNKATDSSYLLQKIKNTSPTGATNIYDTSIKAIEILNSEDKETYNLSVILMTDGQSNSGSFENLTSKYKSMNSSIPIYSITFGQADESQLKDIAKLTNAKVFDGKKDLLKAFKEVRGYN